MTHVALAFLSPAIFHEPGRSEWPLFLPVDSMRLQFPEGTKILVAIGGWGDTLGFSLAAVDEASRKAFAENVARMVMDTGADGILPLPAPFPEWLCVSVGTDSSGQVWMWTGSILGKDPIP